jgi:hypothetical protein
LVVGRTGYHKQEWDSYIHTLQGICDNQIKCDNYLGNPGKSSLTLAIDRIIVVSHG